MSTAAAMERMAAATAMGVRQELTDPKRFSTDGEIEQIGRIQGGHGDPIDPRSLKSEPRVGWSPGLCWESSIGGL